MSATEQPSPEVIDTARDAAAGTRAAAKWMASALGAIPSLAIVGAIVRDPGEGGFDTWLLAIGVALAALGAIISVVAFARVIAPVRVEDEDLRDAHLRRIPGQPYGQVAELQANLRTLRSLAVAAEFAEDRAVKASKRLEVAAVLVQQDAAERAAAAKADPNNARLQVAAQTAQAEADTARRTADAAAATAAAKAAGAGIYAEQLARTDQIRADGYSLLASDEVNARFTHAQVLSFFTVALIAVGIVFIGVAPEPKPATPAAATVTLVTLKPNEAGQTALGCAAAELTALRTGGTDAAPEVITLPTADCPAKTLTFATTDPKPLGTATAIDPVKVDG